MALTAPDRHGEEGCTSECFLGKGIAEPCVCPDFIPEGAVITICSRCKQTISETFDKGSVKKVSHGICSGCLTILESDIRESAKATENGPKPAEAPLLVEDP